MEAPVDILDPVIRTIVHNQNWESVALFIWGLYKFEYFRVRQNKVMTRLDRLEYHPTNMFPIPERTICGYRFGEKSWYSSKHLGVDYKAAKGTPLKAPFDGEILSVNNGFAGGLTILYKPDHDAVAMRFMHLSKILIGKGHVSQGQVIGYTGNTGFLTTGAHLHIDCTRNWNGSFWNDFNNFIDPETYNWDWVPEVVIPAPTVIVPVETEAKFKIVVHNPFGYKVANFRNEPNTTSAVFATYPNGTVVNCNAVVTGQMYKGSDQWFKSSRSGKYISSTLAIKQ